MKIKKELIILGVVIAALAVYLFQRSSDRTRYTLPAVPALSAGDITKIQLTRPDQTVEMVRRDGRWVLEPKSYPVDPKLAREMLDTIAGLALTALVAESKNYAPYELDEDHKVNVKAWQADQLRRDFDVGKAAPSFRHTFVRLAGDDRVFHGQDNFSFRFRTAVDDLRDKTVLALNPRDIREIQVEAEGASLILVRSAAQAESPPAAQAVPGAWQGPDGRTADNAAVESLLNELSSLQCDTFIEDRDKAALGRPAHTIVMKGSQEYTLSIFAPAAPEATDRPAVSSGSDYPFRLSEDRAMRIMKSPADFFKTEEKDEKKEG